MDWVHRPEHRFVPDTTYMLTAATLHHTPYFQEDCRLSLLRNLLLDQASIRGWEIHAWVVLPNHYHLVATSPAGPCRLREWISAVHAISAREINRMDRTPGRRIWFQFWDTCIRTEAGWFARLHYVMDNPVKHGLVKLPDEWAHGSAVRFLCEATPGEVKRVFSYGCDRVGVPDAF